MLYGSTTQDLGYTDRLLSSTIGGRFYMGLATYEPGAERPNEPIHLHTGEEYGVIIKGEYEMTLGNEAITLFEGDSYSFNATVRHHGRNRSSQETVLVWAVSPVVIPRYVEVPRSGEETS